MLVSRFPRLMFPSSGPFEFVSWFPRSMFPCVRVYVFVFFVRFVCVVLDWIGSDRMFGSVVIA